MGKFRPLATKCFLAFLEFMGFSYKRTESSLDLFSRAGTIRNVVIRTKDKEVPAFHLKTNCRTLGCTMEQLYKWADRHC